MDNYHIADAWLSHMGQRHTLLGRESWQGGDHPRSVRAEVYAVFAAGTQRDPDERESERTHAHSGPNWMGAASG